MEEKGSLNVGWQLFLPSLAQSPGPSLNLECPWSIGCHSHPWVTAVTFIHGRTLALPLSQFNCSV